MALPDERSLILECRGLCCGYDRLDVLHETTISVLRGQMVSVLGPNGSGRTTFLYTIAGILPPLRGKVLLDGVDVSQFGLHQRSRRGLMIIREERNIFRQLTVEENLRLVVGRWPSGRSGISRVVEWLPPLANRLTTRADRLSGGEQSLLAIAMALLREPKLLLVDELSLGLQPRWVDVVKTALLNEREHRGMSVIFVEQDARLVSGLADRRIFIQDGRVTELAATT